MPTVLEEPSEVWMRAVWAGGGCVGSARGVVWDLGARGRDAAAALISRSRRDWRDEEDRADVLSSEPWDVDLRISSARYDDFSTTSPEDASACALAVGRGAETEEDEDEENAGKSIVSLPVRPVKERKLESNFDPSKHGDGKESALSSGRIGMENRSE